MKIFKARKRAFANPIILAFFLTFAGLFFFGCGFWGRSPGGPNDNPNGGDALASVHESEVLYSTITITGVIITSPPIVNFAVLDPEEEPLTNLSSNNFLFTIAKLVPGQNGDSDDWQSYLNTTEIRNPEEPGDTPPFFTTLQAEGENHGTLDNHGDGSYTYTFATDIENITSPPHPIAVSFEEDLTHRVGVELRGDVPKGDATFTFVPSGAPIVLTREVVAVSSCNQCHEKLSYHEEGRFDTKYCVTCHNPGTTDANSGQSLDFKRMIHKIHIGNTYWLQFYKVWGDGDQNIEVDYTDVRFPQIIQKHCLKCHDNTEAVNADQWKTRPTRQACGSCHYFIDWETGLFHTGDAQEDDSQCANCHPPSGTNDAIEDNHYLFWREDPSLMEEFKFNILSITNTGPGQFPVVVISVTDPTENDTPYDILNNSYFTDFWKLLVLAIGWNIEETPNLGSGNVPAQPIEIDINDTAVNNGDDTFTITSPVAIPEGMTGSGVVAFLGRPISTGGNRIPVKTELQYFPITQTPSGPRREIVDVNKCNQCHWNVNGHDYLATNNIEACVICHNRSATDIIGRQANPDPPPIDGKDEEAIELKYLIHAIHAGQESEYGFRENGIVYYGFQFHHDESFPFDFRKMRYPQILNNCQTCHIDNPDPNQAGDATIDTGEDLNDPLDDLILPPWESTCISCHDNLFE